MNTLDTKYFYTFYGSDSLLPADYRVMDTSEKDALYDSLIERFGGARTKSDYEALKQEFESLKGYRGADGYIARCEEKIGDRPKQREARQEKQKEQAESGKRFHLMRNAVLVVLAVVAVIALYSVTVDLIKASKYNVGEVVVFGEYEWYVISKDGNGLTLLSKDIIDYRAYNDDGSSTTWEECTLRQWLNEDFYNTFTDEEKKYIVKTNCENKDNNKYGTDGGNDTEDYIFLLSLDEAETIDESIRAAGAWWWLRSPGYSLSRAALVNYVGSHYDFGYGVYYGCGVRPALNLQF